MNFNRNENFSAYKFRISSHNNIRTQERSQRTLIKTKKIKAENINFDSKR